MSDSFEELVQAYRAIALEIKKLEEKKKELSLSIMQQMPTKTLNLEECTVRVYERTTIGTSLEEARLFSATKMEEVVDKEKVKKMHEEGVAIPGISHSKFIQVAAKKVTPA